MNARIFVPILIMSSLTASAADTPKKEARVKEIAVPASATSSMAASLAVRLRFARERINPGAPDWNPGKADAAKKEIDGIQKELDRLAEGKAALPLGKTLLMGYHAELDDSDQPYSLYIPPEYDGSAAFPLVVFLHGQGMFNPLQCNANPIGKNIVVAPQGRGGMDYMYVGEGDVMRVIDEVQGYLKIDPDRIMLAGASMGGAGSWHLAAAYPDRFAGIMALCGNTDINVWQQLWLWQTPKDSPIAKVRHFLREDTCSATYAENLHNVGILALQGEADPIVNQLHGRHILDRLKALGHPNFQVHFLPYVMHSFSCDYAKGLNFTRLAKPTRVRYQTSWLKYPGAYWLKISGIEQRLQHANVDGTADAEKKTIQIKTQNVGELSIERSMLPIQGTPTEIFIDGQSVHTGSVRFVKTDDNSWFGTSDSRFQQSADVHKFPPQKNAQIEGPAEHAFMSRFVVVLPDSGGASGDPKDPKIGSGPVRVAAKKAAIEFNEMWKTRYAVPCRINVADKISEQDIADSNLILYGTPVRNSLIQKVVGKLPIAFERDGIRFNNKLFTGPNLGAILCYPNPLNPNRYVVLICGTTPESFTDITVRFGNWFDWVPYDYRKHYDFAIFDDLTSGKHPETFLTWGFFGENWELKPETTFNAVPAFREKLLPRVFPRDFTAVPDVVKGAPPAPPETRFLDEIKTRGQSVTKEYLERNRTLDGNVLMLNGKEFKRGLCARFPYSLTFDCKGYARLKTTAGVWWDGKSEVSGDRKQSEKVTVKVEADGKTLFEAFDQTYRSQPLEIDVDLSGATSVTLSASGGLSWLNGSFIFADARFEGLAATPAPEKSGTKERSKKAR